MTFNVCYWQQKSEIGNEKLISRMRVQNIQLEEQK